MAPRLRGAEQQLPQKDIGVDVDSSPTHRNSEVLG